MLCLDEEAELVSGCLSGIYGSIELNNEQGRGTCQGVRGSGKGQGQGDVETPSNASKDPTVPIPSH